MTGLNDLTRPFLDLSSSAPMSSSASRILLTGANGFLGYQITKALLERGHTVVGTVRSESKTKYLKEKFSKFTSGDEAKLKFAIVEDIAKPGVFDEVLRTHQFDAIIHSSSPYIMDA